MCVYIMRPRPRTRQLTRNVVLSGVTINSKFSERPERLVQGQFIQQVARSAVAVHSSPNPSRVDIRPRGMI